jgi:hypothetical protein
MSASFGIESPAGMESPAHLIERRKRRVGSDDRVKGDDQPAGQSDNRVIRGVQSSMGAVTPLPNDPLFFGPWLPGRRPCLDQWTQPSGRDGHGQPSPPQCQRDARTLRQSATTPSPSPYVWCRQSARLTSRESITTQFLASTAESASWLRLSRRRRPSLWLTKKPYATSPESNVVAGATTR